MSKRAILDSEDGYLPSRAVCERYDFTPRTLSRWEQREELDFPAPMVVNGRKYYCERKLREWERARVKGSIDTQNDANRCRQTRAIDAKGSTGCL